MAPDATATALSDLKKDTMTASPSRTSGWRRLMAIPTPLIVFVSLAIAAGVLWRQGSITSLGAIFGRLSPREILVILAIYALGPVLQCLRWDGLIRMIGGTSSLFTAADVFLTSVMVKYAAPIALALPARAALTTRDLGLSIGGSGAIVLWESVLDLIVLAVFSLIWVAMGDIDALRGILPTNQMSWPLVIGIGLLVILLVTGVLAKRPTWRQKVVRTGIDLATYPVKYPGPFTFVVVCTLAYWFVQLVVMWLLLGAIGLEPSVLLVLGLMGLPVLIGMLSLLPGGAGVREALMVTVAGVEGVDAAAVLFAAVAYRAALFLVVPVLYGGLRVALKFRPAPLPPVIDPVPENHPDGTASIST